MNQALSFLKFYLQLLNKASRKLEKKNFDYIGEKGVMYSFRNITLKQMNIEFLCHS